MSVSGDAVHNETKVISARSQARSKLSERRAELLKRISDNQRDLERALASLEKVDKAAVRRDAAIAKANKEFEKKKAAAELAAGRSLAQVAGRGETATSISELVDLDVATVRRLVKLAEENNDSTPPAQGSSEGGSEAKEPTPDVPVAASGS
ncbi:hypothetical protein [Rhodococcus sp. Q1]|uniref:hypothetical protein n=1 Tax=Rhodococcus sp. Q1 TaxID=2508718 RepID=UPI001F5E1E36|nr:hypothetical protein [Rhodococcus sp. Q1]